MPVMCAALAAVLACAPRAAAESLLEALATAYSANPELDAERARQRATDEGVPQALSGARPTITANADIGVQRTWARSVATIAGVPTIVRGTSHTTPRDFNINITQPIFNGFQTFSRTEEAEANVLAGRFLLGNVEQNVLLAAVTAYVDVLRDMALVRLTEGNLDVLREELDSTTARFEVGELTKTDVAQAEARVSGAQSDLSQARANLASSRATYERVVRRPPGSLSQPPTLDGTLPKSLEEAMATAEAEHPALLSSRHSIAASDFEVEAIKGELLPSITLEGDYTRRWEPSATTPDSESASIVGRLRVPLYQAGAVSSRIRQAREVATQRRLESEDVRAEVHAAVATAWDGLIAARAQIVADRQQIRAATVALDGVRQEQRVGQRTTLDVLDAQQELLNAQVNLATSTRNEVVAAYTLLAAVGRLNARYLGLPVAYYDDTIHYNQVRNRWMGLSVDRPY